MEAGFSDAEFNSETGRNLKDKEPSFGNMEPPFGHACRKSKRSASKPTKYRQKDEKAEAPAVLQQGIKRSRLKCNVCSRGFQKETALSRHKQTHVSGALSERYSESSTSCGRDGSVASVQRYLTLNIAIAMKLRGSRSCDKRIKPANSGVVSEDLNVKRGLKGPQLKLIKRNEKLARVPKHKNVDKILLSQIQSDITPVVKRKRIRMTDVPNTTAGLSEGDDGLECLSSKNPLKLSALNVSRSDKGKKTSRTVLDMMNEAWNILDTDTPDVSHPQKLNLKAELKETALFSDVATEDKNPQGTTLCSQQALAEGNRSDQKKQALQLDLLNQMSAVTAMHDRVVELVNSLQGESDKHVHIVMPPLSQSKKTSSGAEAKSSSECSDESESDDSDEDKDNDPEWDDESKSSTSSKTVHSAKKKRKRARRSTFCEICQKDFQNLRKHLFIHYGERTHECKICGKAFYEARVLDKHETTHTKKFKCGVCGEMFSKIRAAKQHAKIHLPDKPYSCEICKQPFRSRGEVRKHLNVHSAIRRYVCDICGQGRHTLTALNSHRRKHTGEKPFVCEICGKSFRYSSGLRVHNFSHTSGKPYPCPVCRESFAHNYLRKRHLLTHETDTASGRDHQGEVARNLPSLNVDHDIHVHVQEDEYLSLQQLSPNSQAVVQFSKLGHVEQTASSFEEPLMQEGSGDQSIYHPQTEQAAPQPSTLSNLRMYANQARTMNKVLGPDSFKQNLSCGTGSRRQTPADSLVVPLCDGSYKSLKDLQRQGVESDDLPRH